MYHSQMLLTRRIIFENLLTHWALDMIIRPMDIPRMPWEVLSINLLIAISTVNRPCNKLISHDSRALLFTLEVLRKRVRSYHRSAWPCQNVVKLKSHINIWHFIKSRYQLLTNWYTLCRTRMCFLHEESFLKTFWHTSHWTSVLLWTSRMCLRKFTTVLSHIWHQLFLPKMTNRFNCGNRFIFKSAVVCCCLQEAARSIFDGEYPTRTYFGKSRSMRDTLSPETLHGLHSNVSSCLEGGAASSRHCTAPSPHHQMQANLKGDSVCFGRLFCNTQDW